MVRTKTGRARSRQYLVDTIDEKSWKTECTAGGKGTIEKVNSCSHCDLSHYIRTKGDASTARLLACSMANKT